MLSIKNRLTKSFLYKKSINKKRLRTEIRGDFNIHGTKFFHNAVFHQKSKKYDVVSLPVPLVGQKTRPPREILTWLFITEDPFRRHFQ